MPRGPTRPTVGPASLNSHQHPFLPTDQNVGDFTKILAGQDYLKLNVPSRNAALAHNGTDFYLAILGKEGPTRSSLMSTGTTCTVIFVLRVPMYSVWSLTKLAVSTLQASFLPSCWVSWRMSHIAFDLLVTPNFYAFNGLFHSFPADPNQLSTLYVVGEQGDCLCVHGVQCLRNREELVPFEILLIFRTLFGIVRRILFIWPAFQPRL